MVKFFLLFLILLLGAALRLVAINYGVPSKNLALTSYHPDEPKSYYTLEQMRREHSLHPHDGLFWGSLHLYTLGASLQLAKWAGYIQAPSREFLVQNLEYADRLYIVGRLVSVFFGVASLLLMFLIGDKIFGYPWGGFAAFFLAVSPVHIVNSFVVRPDIMMLFWILGSLYFALHIENSNSNLFLILSGMCAGFAGASKYNGGIIIFLPFLIVVFSNFSIKKIFVLASACAVGLLVGCPYIVLDFKTWLSYMQMNGGLVETGRAYLLYGSAWKSYWTTFFCYGLGWPLTLLSALGLIIFTSITIKEILTRRLKVLSVAFLGTFAIFYFITTAPQTQMVWYTLPLIGFVILFALSAAKFLSQVFPKMLVLALLIIIGGYNFVYSMAYLNLYRQVNTRELASAWINRNIAHDQSIAIARSYYWTPGSLRQYNPPWRLIQAGSDQAPPFEGVLALPDAAQTADYFVLSECEVNQIVPLPLAKVHARSAKVLNEWVPQHFRAVAIFDAQAQWLGFKFPKRGADPDDWIMPNPRITIYKRRSGTLRENK